MGFGYEREPRPSVYSLAYGAIKDVYDKTQKALTLENVERILTVTPGIMFADGVSLEDALNTLEDWRLLEKNEEGNYVPLDWDKEE